MLCWKLWPRFCSWTVGSWRCCCCAWGTGDHCQKYGRHAELDFSSSRNCFVELMKLAVTILLGVSDLCTKARMGRRKSKRKPEARKKNIEALDTQFTCPFCNHEKSCEVYAAAWNFHFDWVSTNALLCRWKWTKASTQPRSSALSALKIFRSS